MPSPEQFAANIGMLFAELPFHERFEAARASGFSAVEINTPEMFELPAWKLKSAMDAADVKLALFNMPVGDREGDCGLAAQPGREREFEKSLAVTVEYCRMLECKAVHCMAGDRSTDDPSEVNYSRSAASSAIILVPLI